jgi:hypothetical protein
MVANQGDCGRLEVGLGGSSVEDARLLAEMVDLVGGSVQGEIGGNVEGWWVVSGGWWVVSGEW